MTVLSLHIVDINVVLLFRHYCSATCMLHFLSWRQSVAHWQIARQLSFAVRAVSVSSCGQCVKEPVTASTAATRSTAVSNGQFSYTSRIQPQKLTVNYLSHLQERFFSRNPVQVYRIFKLHWFAVSSHATTSQVGLPVKYFWWSIICTYWFV